MRSWRGRWVCMPRGEAHACQRVCGMVLGTLHVTKHTHLPRGAGESVGDGGRVRFLTLCLGNLSNAEQFAVFQPRLLNAVGVCACKLSWRKPGQDLLHRGADGALLPDALTESAKRVQWLALQLEAARRGLHRQRPRSHCPLTWDQLAITIPTRQKRRNRNQILGGLLRASERQKGFVWLESDLISRDGMRQG